MDGEADRQTARETARHAGIQMAPACGEFRHGGIVANTDKGRSMMVLWENEEEGRFNFEFEGLMT